VARGRSASTSARPDRPHAQMLLGSTILATPGLGIYGSSQSVFWRFITGWMLLGIGTINLILVR